MSVDFLMCPVRTETSTVYSATVTTATVAVVGDAWIKPEPRGPPAKMAKKKSFWRLVRAFVEAEADE